MSDQNYFPRPKTAKITTLLRQSWIFSKNNLFKIFLILLIVFIPRLLSNGMKLWLSFELNHGIYISDPLLTIYFYLDIIFFFLLIFLSVLSSIALLIFINSDDPTIKISWLYRQSLKKLLSYLWIFALLLLIITLGFFLFIIPGIIWLISFNFAIYILISEDLRGFAALRRSRALVKNYWWPTAIKYLALFGLFLLLLLPMIIIETFVTSEVAVFIKFFYELAYSFLITLIATPYSFYIYQDLRDIKD